MSEIAIRDTAAISERDVVDGWIGVASDVSKLSDYIAETEFVPKGLRNKPAAIAACILTGRELGIGPMASLKSIHMVQGVPSLSAEYKRARALAAGHQIVIDESTSTRCIVRGRRAGTDQWVTITWTTDMASRAKINAKDVWKQYPQRMLQARATSELCDLLFPDATLGLETTEVLEDGGVLAIAAGAAVETEPATPAEPAKPRTARRRQAATETASPATPAPRAPEPQPTPQAERVAGEAPMPPLPGEEEPDDTDYDTPGTVTKPQLTKLAVVFGELGFARDEREQRLVAASQIVGRELESSSGLSRNEAKALIDTLEGCGGDREKLIALLAGGEAPGA